MTRKITNKESKIVDKKLLKLEKTLNAQRKLLYKTMIKFKKNIYGKYADIDDYKKELKEINKTDKKLINKLK